jgi:hypothetical protein
MGEDYGPLRAAFAGRSSIVDGIEFHERVGCLTG